MCISKALLIQSFNLKRVTSHIPGNLEPLLGSGSFKPAIWTPVKLIVGDRKKGESRGDSEGETEREREGWYLHHCRTRGGCKCMILAVMSMYTA